MNRLPAMLASLCLCASCSNTPLPQIPPEDVPEKWLTAVADAPVWPSPSWWQAFATPELNEVIAKVQAANTTLANSARNLRSAQILLRSAGFDLYPSPVVSFTGALNYAGADVSDTDYFDTTDESWDLRGALVYADILSKPDAWEAALAQYDASVALAADVALNTLALAGSTYFQVLLARDRIATAKQNLDNAIEISDILKARFEAGVINEVDALQQEIAVEQQRNAVKIFMQNELAARASLAALTNRSVREVKIETSSLDDVTVPRVMPGIPAELLLRRPDLVQAEANLRISRANVDLAKTAFLPDISLTASGNLASDQLLDLIEAPDVFVNASLSAAQTLLDNGARSRSVELSELALENAYANYRNAVITAFNDIDVALENIELLDSLAQVALEDRARAEESFRIAEVRYREGVSEFQSVLNSQSALYAARTRYLDNKLARLNAMLALYQALGGGWQAQSGMEAAR